MVRALALLLTMLTGFSGLVYEVGWQKHLAVLLGSHSEATAAVLGIFLGGLAAGYALFGRVARRLLGAARRNARPAPLLRLYGGVEVGIGLYALAFPLLFRLALSSSAAIGLDAEGLGFAFDVLLTIALIGTPTLLMGGTIPLLTQALSHSLEDATRFHALVYASNTAGAFLGAIAAGFVLIEWLGLDGTVRSMGCVNLAAGVIFFGLGARGSRTPISMNEASAPPRVAGFGWFAVSALLSGFAMMSIQTVLNRLGGLAFGASQLTFSMVVAVFVLCIALGSFAVSTLPRIPRGSVVVAQTALVALLLALYGPLENATYWMHALRALFRDEHAGFLPFFFTAFGALLLAFALPIGLSGALLPLLFHELRNEVDDLGSVAGRLYSWNTWGSLCGALLGGYLLLFMVDLHDVFRIALLALCVATALLALRLLPRGAMLVVFAALAAVSVAIVRLEPWRPERVSAGAFRYRAPTPETFEGPEAFFARFRTDERVIFSDDDPVSTVTVRDTETGGHGRSLFTNGKPDTRLPYELKTPLLLGILPCLFATECRSAFVIGLGTGATSGELAALGGMQRVVTAEISPAVTRALPLFGFANQQADQNPRLTIRRADAYRALLRDPDRYDVIVSEPSNPWVVGVENLYSREFLEAAKARLQPGGVYAQWFHVYESSRETMELVLRTYAAVFGAVAIWDTMPGDVVLLGWNDPSDALGIERLERRVREPSIAAALARVNLPTLPALLSRERLPLGVARTGLPAGPIHTLFHPVLSHRAAREFFVGATADPVEANGLAAARIGVRNSLWQRYRAADRGSSGDDDRAAFVAETCLDRPVPCATAIAWWRHEAPDSPLLAEAEATLSARGVIRPERVALLERFFGDGCASSPAGVSLAEVERWTVAFERYYHHATPFRRSALASCWDRCRDRTSGTECREARAKMEARLGDLHLDATNSSAGP